MTFGMIVQLPVSVAFGSDEEFDLRIRLERELSAALAEAGAGECAGGEIDTSHLKLHLEAIVDPRSALDVTKAVLARAEVLGRAVVVLGDALRGRPRRPRLAGSLAAELLGRFPRRVTPARAVHNRASGRGYPAARPNPLPPPARPLQYSLFRITLEGEHAMAHKKGQGSVRNGRDSVSKRRGIKAYAGQFVTTGSIIVTQCGTRYSAGTYVRRAKNDSLFALTDGTVYFDQSGKRVNLTPTDPADTHVR